MQLTTKDRENIALKRFSLIAPVLNFEETSSPKMLKSR